MASGLMSIQLEPRCSFIVAMWAPKHVFALHETRIPMDIITRGESIGWRKIKSACTNFLTGRETPMQLKKRKVAENQDETYSTKLNNELNGNVDPTIKDNGKQL